MSGIIDVNEGKSNKYLLPGIGVIITALILIVFGLAGHWIFLIPGAGSFVFSIFLFNATNGIEFDGINKKYRVYGKIGNKKNGTWVDISNIKLGMLTMYNDNSSHSFAPMGAFVPPTQEKVITYDLIYIDENEQKHTIHDFLKYSKGKKALKGLGDAFNVPVKDKIAEKLISNQRKPRR